MLRAKPIRVLMASDVRLYREGMERLLRDEDSIVLAGLASSAADAAEQSRQLVPDVVLLDMSMDKAYFVAKQVARDSKVTKVIALGMPEVEVEVISCAEVGIAGYVPREGSLTEVIAAIDAAARGEVHCSAKVAGFLFRRIAALSADRSSNPSPVGGLTVREAQILRLLEQGMSNKMISRSLGIEPPTVKNHVQSILSKLGVHRRAEAISLLHRQVHLLTNADRNGTARQPPESDDPAGLDGVDLLVQPPRRLPMSARVSNELPNSPLRSAVRPRGTVRVSVSGDEIKDFKPE